MTGKKKIRILVTAMVELETELEVDEAVTEFTENSHYAFDSTENVTVINTEWRETEKVSYIQYSKDGKSTILKPLKNQNETRY